jgi:choline transport protein
MNYVSAVYAVVVAIIAIDWLTRGRKEYRGQTDRREAINETLRRASVASHPSSTGGAQTGAGEHVS